MRKDNHLAHDEAKAVNRKVLEKRAAKARRNQRYLSLRKSQQEEGGDAARCCDVSELITGIIEFHVRGQKCFSLADVIQFRRLAEGFE